MIDRDPESDATPILPPMDWLEDLLAGRSEVEREDFLVALLLNAGFDPRAVSTPVAALLERFAIRVDLEPGPPDSVNQQIADYFEMHPLPTDLVQAFEHRFRSDLLTQDPETFRATMDRLGREMPGYEPREAVKEGTHQGGALGFFAARAEFDRR